MAPAVLKSVAEQAGFRAVGIDENISVANLVRLSPNREELKKFFFDEIINDKNLPEVLEFIYQVADKILSYQPKIIALSLLTYGSKVFTHWLCVHLKSVSPSTTIVIGGPGIRNSYVATNDTFADHLKSQGLIDDYIVGDGEISVVEYLKGNKNYPGINNTNWTQLPNLNDLPHPNYDDYDFDRYDRPCIPVIESRGCVRTCEFCDVIEHWTKFQARTAENVFDEITSQIKKYQIKKISMRNSLTNGNMKVFKKILSRLSRLAESADG
jgi:hypothetical protein